MPKKRDRSTGISTPPTKKTKEGVTQAETESCISCDLSIEDNGLLCEFCYHWEHSRCAGISDEAYDILSDSSPNIMFFCTTCRPKVTGALKFFNEMQDKQNALEAKIAKIEDNLRKQTSFVKRLENVEAKVTSGTERSNQVLKPSQPIAPTKNAAANPAATYKNNNQLSIPKPASSLDKKFNVVVYGLKESPANTSKHDRTKHDLDCLMKVFSDLKLSITPESMKDFHRLGKYDQNNTHPRPILVKFLRAFEATLVLSCKSSLSSGIAIKPDMSAEERKIESILLKERRSLIDSGTESKHIKIRGNGLYINHKLYAAVQNSQLCLLSASLQPVTNVSNTATSNAPNASTNSSISTPSPMEESN